MSIFSAAQSRAQYRNDYLPSSGIGKNIQSWLLDWLGGSDTVSGVKIDADSAISLSTVFNALTILSESIAQLPLSPYIEEKSGDLINKRKFAEHSSYNLVHMRPNELMSSFTFRKVMQSYLCRYDNAYAIIERGGFGQPISMFPWPVPWVTPYLDGKGGIIYECLDGYAGGEKFYVSSANMIHLIGYTENGLIGKSRIQILADALGTAKAGEQFAGKFYGKGINVSGFIQTQKPLRDEGAVERLKNSFVQKYGGTNNQFGVGILEDGATWIPNEIDPEKAQLTDTRKINGQVVAQIFNIPLPLLKYIEDAKYSNVEQLDIQFTKYTLTPWLVNWEQEYWEKLLTEREKAAGNIYYKHNLNALLRGDMNTRGQFYERMQRTGAYSPNDILEHEDENGYEGGNVHVINPGAQTVEQVQQAGQENTQNTN